MFIKGVSHVLTIKTRRKPDDWRAMVPLSDCEADNRSIKLFRIKHLRVASDEEGRQFWISQKHKHNSMRELIEYYKEAEGTSSR